jgi:hypothetical protein
MAERDLPTPQVTDCQRFVRRMSAGDQARLGAREYAGDTEKIKVKERDP